MCCCGGRIALRKSTEGRGAAKNTCRERVPRGTPLRHQEGVVAGHGLGDVVQARGGCDRRER